MICEKKITAIVLAGGRGKRMNTKISKQYLQLGEKPLLYYSLAAFEKSNVDEIILVTAAGEEAYCREEIVDLYQLTKVIKIVPGGKERYHSVYQGLLAVGNTDIVMIHDGARPFLTEEIIQNAAKATIEYHASVVAVPVKDTIKIANNGHYITETPDRKYLWQVQTPQSFCYPDILHAYETILESEYTEQITDDAMVWESATNIPIKIIEGSYCNIKITTKEDMVFGEALLRNKDILF